MNPLAPFIERQGFVLLDGGLATELERHGHALDDALWSARLLADDPAAIQRVHEDYLNAGADCLITASYQASMAGFQGRGLQRDEAVSLIRRSVELAITARDRFWAVEANREGRQRPLVAASVGPYGACLANGAEYTGEYDIDEAGLLAFHRERWHTLAGSDADLLACETIPSAREALALARLIAETPEKPVWVSFSCRDDERISDGTPIVDAVRPLGSLTQVMGIGVNCTRPSHVGGLIGRLRAVTDRLIVAYPNSGERYEAATRSWSGISSAGAFASASLAWFADGARVIGGCCRTGPGHIEEMRRALAARQVRPEGSER
jgi:homocysteine S-methyltransferase